MDEDFQLLQPLDLITKDVDELQKIIKEKKENLIGERPRGKEKDPAENDREHEREPSKEREKEKQQKEKDRDRERMEKEREKEKEKGKDKEKPHEEIPDIKQGGDKIGIKQEENGTGEGNLHFVTLRNVHG